MMIYTYNDLLRSDGSLNQAAFNAILDSRVLAEINQRLCVAAGHRLPRSVPFADARAWYAAKVRELKLGPLSNEEVARITTEQRAEIETWVQTMQASARHQRRVMDDAYHLEAAE